MESFDLEIFRQESPPLPEPTTVQYIRDVEPKEISLKLVGKSPLWGHLLWNAGKVTADWVDSHPEMVVGKRVLELGAGSALPSLLACLAPAKKVVITDYPDPDLIDNINTNVKTLEQQVGHELPASVLGYIWGHPVEPLIEQSGGKFDLIILSDLIFNHSQHGQLIATIKRCLSDNGIVLVVFTPHRPKLYENDMNFFKLATDQGFTVTKILETKMQPMFEEAEGAELRGTVFGYMMHMHAPAACTACT